MLMRLMILSALSMLFMCSCVSPEIKQARQAEEARLENQRQMELAKLAKQRREELAKRTEQPRVEKEKRAEQRRVEAARLEEQRRVEAARLEEQRRIEKAKRVEKILAIYDQNFGNPDKALMFLGTPTNRSEGDKIFILEYKWSDCACNAIFSYDKKTNELVDWNISPCKFHGWKRFGFPEDL